MKKISIIFIFLLILLFKGGNVFAQIIEPHPECPGGACWPTRTINEWSCTDCDAEWRCGGNTNIGCAADSHELGDDAKCVAAGTTGPCIYVCPPGTDPFECHVWDKDVICNWNSATVCQWAGWTVTCGATPTGCNFGSFYETKGCCGPSTGGVTPTATPPPATPTPIPGCSVSAPSNSNVNNLTPTSVTLDWLEGTGGTSANLLRLGEDINEVEANCPGVLGVPCLVATELTRGIQTYNTGNILTPGTTYYWRIAEYDVGTGDDIDFGGVCNDTDSEAFTTPVASCSITLLDITLNGVGDTQTATVSITDETGGTIDQVEFIPFDPGIATVTSPDLAPSFSTDATGVSLGSTTYTATATMVDEGNIQCVDTASINVNNPPGWWQVKEGDAMCIGNISSQIPAGATDPYFMTHDPGDFAGIPIYSGTIDVGGSGDVSDTPASPGWRAEGALYSSIPKDYQYFWNRIQSSIAPESLSGTVDAAYLRSNGTSSGGYRWYERTGDLDISGGDIQAQKVIVFVDGNLTISGNFNLTRGLGFFIAIVSGDITIDPAVGAGAGLAPHVEGMFVSNGQFITQTSGSGDDQLHIRGSVAGLSGLSLNRSLPDNATDPAEIFEYAIDQAFLYPINLGIKNYLWREIAP